jgi:hypothetical protein
MPFLIVKTPDAVRLLCGGRKELQRKQLWLLITAASTIPTA